MGMVLFARFFTLCAVLKAYSDISPSRIAQRALKAECGHTARVAHSFGPRLFRMTKGGVGMLIQLRRERRFVVPVYRRMFASVPNDYSKFYILASTDCPARQRPGRFSFRI